MNQNQSQSQTPSASASSSTLETGDATSSLSSSLKGKGRDMTGSIQESDPIQAPKPDQTQVSQTNKAIAACTGAIAVSLLMTPFDVIKTRLQTQTPISHPKLFIPDPHLHYNHPSDPTESSYTSTSDKSSTDRSSSSSRQSASSSSRSSSSRSTLQSSSLTSTSTSHPATCCQQTFFTTNSNSPSLICRYDPRGIPIMVPAESVGRLALPPQPQPSTSTTSSTSSTTSNRPPPPPIGRNLSLSSETGHNKVKIRASEKDCAFPNQKEATKALRSYNEKMHEGRLKGLWDGVWKVGKGEGVRGLWRGLSPTL